MPYIRRRKAILGFAFLLTSCTNLVPPTSLAAIVADGQQVDQVFLKIAPMIASAYPALLTKAGVTLAQITNGSTGWLDIAGSTLAGLAAKGSPASSASTVQVVEEYFNKFMDVASSITTAVNPTLGLAIGAASVLIAGIENVVGVPAPTTAAALNIPPRQPAITRAKALAPGMTPAAARGILTQFLVTPASTILTKPHADIAARAARRT